MTAVNWFSQDLMHEFWFRYLHILAAIVAVIAEAKRLHDAGISCVVTPPQPGQKPTMCEAAQKANWGPYADWGLMSSQAQLAVVKVYQEIEGKLP